MAKRGAPRTKTPAKWTKEQLRQIDEMAESQAKDTMIAESLGVDVQTFKREFTQRCRTKRAQGKARILRRQFEKATAGDATMLIWTGKQHLEQSDKQDHKIDASKAMRELLGWVGGRNGGNHGDDDAQD